VGSSLTFVIDDGAVGGPTSPMQATSTMSRFPGGKPGARSLCLVVASTKPSFSAQVALSTLLSGRSRSFSFWPSLFYAPSGQSFRDSGNFLPSVRLPSCATPSNFNFPDPHVPLHVQLQVHDLKADGLSVFDSVAGGCA
jgi:hypothetical protein